MKTYFRTFAIAAALCAGLFTAHAAGKRAGGPKGGRLLEKTEPHAEFLVEKDRTVSIHFYDQGGKAVAATTQRVTVIANARSGKSTLEFEKKGDSLVSTAKLPQGDGYPVVVQFQQTADAKPQNLRFKLDMYTCGGCKRAEYACTCDH